MFKYLKSSLIIKSKSQNNYKLKNTYRVKHNIVTNKMHLLPLSQLIKFGLIAPALFSFSLSGYATLSVSTSKTIQGSAPYFVLEYEEGTKTEALSTEQLLSFQYKDKDGISTFANVSDASSTIIVDSKMKINELVTLVDIDNTKHSVNDLVNAEASKLTVGDNEGDAINSSAFGTLTATLKLNGKVITPTETEFDGCGIYTLDIAATADSGMKALRAQTKYGDPYFTDYIANKVTYTIKPYVAIPYACYAQPTLTWATDKYAGSPTQWEPTKGFIANSTAAHPTSNTSGVNFPTTGFNYAYFNLTLAGTTAQQVIADSANANGEVHSGNSDVFLKLETVDQAPNVLKVTLLGPNDSATNPSLPTKAYTATAFNLKSGVDTIYRFSIDKWFVFSPEKLPYSSDQLGGNPVGSPNETLQYCNKLSTGGVNYKIPSAADYTNAPMPTQGGNYTRTIGAGLFAEWGYPYNNYYTSSNYISTAYWTDKVSNSSRMQYAVWASDGSISIYYANQIMGVACVSPL